MKKRKLWQQAWKDRLVNEYQGALAAAVNSLQQAVERSLAAAQDRIASIEERKRSEQSALMNEAQRRCRITRGP